MILVLSLIVVLLMSSLGLVYKLYLHEKNERDRYNQNMITLIKDKSRQQELTAKELRDLYPKYDSLASELNIKTKYITNIINTKYNFKDSTIISTVLKRDSIKNESTFTFQNKCYTLSGFVTKDSVSLTNREFNDDITTFLYKNWEKKYLWGLFKFKPYYKAVVYSQCMNDTISVNNNIKIKE
jgi:hypothetical protein